MKLQILFSVALCGIVHAGLTSSDDHSLENAAKGSKNYSYTSSGLRSIAQGSAHRAHSAVTQQTAAAKQASYLAKSTLAVSAVQAAATAQAARAGKQILLINLENQVADAQRILNAEQQQVEIARQASERATATVHRALEHFNTLTSVANSAQQVLKYAESNAEAIATVFASGTESSSDAKDRYYGLVRQLENVRAEFEATKEAAAKASQAAQTAKNNAAAAAENVYVEHDSVTKADENKNELTPTAWKSKDVELSPKWAAIPTEWTFEGNLDSTGWELKKQP